MSRRESVIVAVFWGEDAGRRQIELEADPEILRIVREEFRDGGLCSDRLLYRYGEWICMLRDPSQQMTSVTIHEKLLREWVNRFWNRPEMGGWVCMNCIRMDDHWEESH